MSAEEGFIDLRLNRQDSQNGESFWPSFTDIMTVVVMIFMISMLVLLLRNMELVRQLRSTMDAERSAAALARATGKEKENLSLKLIATENELSMVRMRLMRAEEQREKLEDQVQGQQDQISALSGQRDELSMQTQRLKSKNDQLSDDLSSARGTLDTVRQDLANLQTRYQATQGQLHGLEDASTKQRQELEQAKSLILAKDKRLADLQGSYDDLTVRYDKLVKPARTAAGKYVVEVRYSKVGGKYVIEYREPAQADFTQVSRLALEDRLAILKKRDPDGLYIKVIFPKDSGLSYNEAWSLTSDLHKKYDYYFQDAPEDQP